MTNGSDQLPPAHPDEFWSASESALIARLSRRPPELLARFILTLAYDDNGIGEYVRAFIEADDVSRCATLTQSSIERIFSGERPYDRRHALDAVFLRRLDHVLDTIESVILPVAAATARDLLKGVVAGQNTMENQLHEADTQPTFARARELLRKGAAAVQDIETDRKTC